MAARFWVGGTGNWDASTTTNWAATSGGAGGASVPTSADDVTFDSLSNSLAFTVTITATGNCANLVMGNPLAGALTFAGASTLNVFGTYSTAAGVLATHTGSITFSATSGTKTITSNGVVRSGNLKFNGSGGTFQLIDGYSQSGSSDINMSAGTFDANGQTVTLTGSLMTITPTSAITFYNLSRIPTTPANTDALKLFGDITVSNLFTVSDGATTTNRVLVYSSAVGTARTITAAAVSIANADFQDITGAGAASWNLSAASGGSGNCGGNTMQALGDAAFTTTADQHWTNASSGNWSTSGNWTSRVPLPQDNVFMDKAFGTSQTVTADMPRLGKSIDWTGATWTTELDFIPITQVSAYGSYILISGLTFNSNANITTLAGRGSFNLNTNGVTHGSNITVNAPTGTYTLKGDLTLLASKTLTVTNGTLTALDGASNRVISTGALSVATGCTLTLSPVTHSLTGTSAVFTNSGTLTAGAYTLKVTDTSATAITLTLGTSKTYNNIWLSRGSSTATNTITATTGVTVNQFKDDGTGAHTNVYPNITMTLTGGTGAFSVVNTSNKTSLTRTGASGNWTLAGAGTQSCDYVNISNGIAPANGYYAGANSTDGGGNTYWIFTAPPAVSKGNFLLFF